MPTTEERLIRALGTLDGNSIVSLLKENAIDIESDVDFQIGTLRLPLDKIKNKEQFLRALPSLSKRGRSFVVAQEGELCVINTFSMSVSLPVMHARTEYTNKEKPGLGITDDKTELPYIATSSRVLDVGAGRGLIAKRLKDKYGCYVYALEPSFERPSDYDDCVNLLGADCVLKKTLQDALIDNPSIESSFDVVTVFKYNVYYSQKEDFIASLARVVKPDGLVYLTSVEHERLYPEPSDPTRVLYLKDVLEKYFSNVIITERVQQAGADLLVECTGPKKSLTMKP